MKDAHEVLGVAADADARQIRAAYIARLRNTHPDMGGGGESISDIVRAYRLLQLSASGKRRAELGRVVSLRLKEVPPPRRPFSPLRVRFGRSISLLILAVAITAAVYASSGRPNSDGVAKAASSEARLVASTMVWGDRKAIDPSVVRQAVSAARTFASNTSLLGLEQHSRRCFVRLEGAPSVTLLDYCLAFDSAAINLQGGAGAAGDTGQESFFHPGQMSVRHQQAVRRLFPDDAAADARHSEVEARATSELIRSLPI